MRRTLTVVGLVGMASAGAVAAVKALVGHSARRPAPVAPLPEKDHNVGHQLSQAVDRFRESFGA